MRPVFGLCDASASSRPQGLQFFIKHILRREWRWIYIVKPPQIRTLSDVLTLKEIERLINGTRELRYQTFILVSFSMGLR